MKKVSKNRRNKKKGIFYYSLLGLGCITLIASMIFIFLKLSIERKYDREYKELIDDYYEQQTDNFDNNENDEDIISVATRLDAITNTGNLGFQKQNYKYQPNVDSILRVADLSIEIPVCKGNFMTDMEAFRLSVYDDAMTLGETTYSILGHHARSFEYAFGWLDSVKNGMQVTLEKDNNFYNYKVTSIEVGYAADMPQLFTVEDENVIYLATCDYSLGKRENVVYRLVKCESY